MATPTAVLAVDEARTGPFGPSTTGATAELRHDNTSCINRAVDGRVYSQRRPPRSDQRGPTEERSASAGGDAPTSRQHYPSAQANLATQGPHTLPPGSMWVDSSTQTGPQAMGEYRMMYAFDADGNVSQDCYSLAPVFVHNGHSVVPYYAWDLSAGYPPHPEGANRGRGGPNGGRNNNNNNTNNNNNHRKQQQQQRQFVQQHNQQPHQQLQQQQQQRRGNPPKHSAGRRKSDSEQDSVCSQPGLMRSSSSAGSLASNEAAIRMAAMTALAGARGDSSIYARCISAPASPSTNGLQIGGLWNPSATTAAGGGGMPSVADASDDAPDLERFLRVSTPSIPRSDTLEGMASLQLSALWRCFEHPSAYGLECPTLGGPRGPSNCYFVPFLSAVQLYEPVNEGEESSGAGTGGAGRQDDSGVFVYPQGLDSWPAAMRKSFEWSAADHVAERLPVSQRIQELCREQGDEHPVVSSRLLDLHPYSWFAVAWYPLYRIPEAPLTARFLTFHSLAPLWEAASQAEMQLQRLQAVTAADSAATAPSAAAAAGGGGGSASYKLMLSGGALNNPAAAAAAAGGVPSSGGPSATTASGLGIHSRRSSTGVPATPTGITSFPGSPLASSDVTRTATSTTMSGSRSHSVASAPATASDSASVTASFGSSLPPSPAGSDNGDERQLPLPIAGCYDSLVPQSTSVEIPAVGLCWHTTIPSSSHGRNGADNWTDTLVAVDLPPQIGGRGLRPGDALPGPTNARVAGVWPGTAVIRKDYPLAKGGPLSWEIQLEELEEGARRLALSLGLVKAETCRSTSSGDMDSTATVDGSCDTEPLPADSDLAPLEPESCCPDFDFFWARKR